VKPACCYRCGSSSHKAPECKFDGSCDYCKKSGHKQQVCKKKVSDDARAHVATVIEDEVVVRAARVFDEEYPPSFWDNINLPDPPRVLHSVQAPSVPADEDLYPIQNVFMYKLDYSQTQNFDARYTNSYSIQGPTDLGSDALSLFDQYCQNLGPKFASGKCEIPSG
jgi:hypothetical protein